MVYDRIGVHETPVKQLNRSSSAYSNIEFTFFCESVLTNEHTHSASRTERG